MRGLVRFLDAIANLPWWWSTVFFVVVTVGLGLYFRWKFHKIIHDGKDRMPAFGSQMTDAQIDKVIEHIKSLDAAKGSGSG